MISRNRNSPLLRRAVLGIVIGIGLMAAALLMRLPPSGALFLSLVATGVVGNALELRARRSSRECHDTPRKEDRRKAIQAVAYAGVLVGLAISELLAIRFIEYEAIGLALTVATLVVAVFLVIWARKRLELK